jgi:hypothetical protein
MDVVRKKAAGGAEPRPASRYVAPRLELLGSLRDLTQTEVPETGSELGPAKLF